MHLAVKLNNIQVVKILLNQKSIDMDAIDDIFNYFFIKFQLNF